MNVKQLWAAQGPKVRKALEQYKWILLVIGVGALLLALPSGGSKAEQGERALVAEPTSFNLEAMEQKLSSALSEVAGAGEVTVVLTVKTGTRQVLAEDNKFSDGNSGTEEESKAVILSRGSGVQETVKLQEIYPKFQGALVICDGGSDPAIRLKLTEATSALTGLGADKISICSRGK